MSRTQILLASTLYGAATLAAALDAGCFPPADRRLLLVSNNAAVPETSPALDAMPGFQALRDRFDGVLSWNAAIAPFHPSGWAPRPDDEPLWERYLRLLWDLGDDHVDLAVESIQVDPALALAELFPSASIDVYADGLMSYGPTRNRIDLLVATRIRRLVHPDLLPGLRPLLLSEYGVPAHTVPTGALLDVLARIAEHGTDLPEPGPDGQGPALLLGQYLSALGIITAEQEEQLHLRMLRGAAARGHRSAVFKPHPTAPARWSRLLEKEAAELGVQLRVLDTPVLAEVLFQRLRPALVVGCFSTALVTASALYGLPVARTGTGELLGRLTPYQNSNRIPLVLADAALPPLDGSDDPGRPGGRPAGTALGALVRSVGYCMQPSAYPHLREEAVAYLAAHPQDRSRYVTRRRLASLALPGGVPTGLAFLPAHPAVRRTYRRLRAAGARLRGAGAEPEGGSAQQTTARGGAMPTARSAGASTQVRKRS